MKEISTELHELSIFAVNPDNRSQVESIIELVELMYSRSFPLHRAYDYSYWQSRIGNRFVSLVAEYKGQIIAHLAAYPDNDNSGNVQILFPFVHPAYSELTATVFALLVERVLGLALRQLWKSVYFFEGIAPAEINTVISEELGTVPVAVCPGYLCQDEIQATTNGFSRSSGEAPERSSCDIVVSQRILRHDRKKRKIYLPLEHQEFCSTILKSLGVDMLSPDEETNIESSRYTSEMQALSIHHYRSSNVSHIYVRPSLLKNAKALVESIRSSELTRRAAYVFVNGNDPLAPTVARELQHSAFCFCGILPNLYNQDSLVYCDGSVSMVSDALLNNKRTAFLAEYINGQLAFKKGEIKEALDGAGRYAANV